MDDKSASIEEAGDVINITISTQSFYSSSPNSTVDWKLTEREKCGNKMKHWG